MGKALAEALSKATNRAAAERGRPMHATIREREVGDLAICGPLDKHTLKASVQRLDPWAGDLEKNGLN